jgi:hypothetical protein
MLDFLMFMVVGGIVIFIVFKWAQMKSEAPKEEKKKDGITVTRKKK